jgi:hypothetical protein
VQAKDAKTLTTYSTSTKSQASVPLNIVLNSLIPKVDPQAKSEPVVKQPEVILPTKQAQAEEDVKLLEKQRVASEAPGQKQAPTPEPVKPKPRIEVIEEVHVQTCTLVSSVVEGSSLECTFSLPATVSMATVRLDISSSQIRVLDSRDNLLYCQILSTPVIPDSAQAKWSKKSKVLTVSCILAPK